jgi:hypothetical protein
METDAKKVLSSGYTLRKPPSREDPTLQLWSPEGHWLADIRERAHPGSAEAICSAMNMVAGQFRVSAGLQPGGLPDGCDEVDATHWDGMESA